jgi:glycosyltransferase involved in cell wall biosynthesis
MKKAPIIDIIIPIYNAEKFIGQTLDSLAYQNYTNFNVLCYNDGSTDNSETIVKEFAKKDKRVRLLGSKKIGLVNALNFLIKNARSKLLIRLDADDICEKIELKYL